ncbi:SAM-dependent methyltransferase [Actinophytocola oryzae]|uniref:Methyltransferase family protein n=1 Tax=Actinophytocola oryzae TaxID=502181 RepID=A0A4V3FV74_9PSEU|nr:methyltransferase domain-containing protein [Actinophytocola oryzae]TDV57831.1 methyltransferase family protein [Actinophytocola oryzae]
MESLRVELVRGALAVRGSIRQRGLATTVGLAATTAAGQLAFPLIRARRRGEHFTFQGERLPYAVHRYNNTFRNERAVEISIAKRFLAGSGDGRVLEVGNVLAYYGVTGHTVIDRYEPAPGVLNDDIVDYVPERPFDTVVTVSTLEHVGRDEDPREPEKVFRAFEAVRRCVAPGGRLLVTVPVGYNRTMDEGLRDGAVTFDRETWLIRTTRRNDWRECTREEGLAGEYGHPFTAANTILVGEDGG